MDINKSINRLNPRDIVDYIDAAEKLEYLQNGTLKQLLTDSLISELESLHFKHLPVVVEKPKYVVVRVRAKELGYTDEQIGDGKQLGKFVRSCVEPVLQEAIGKHFIYRYEINDKLDQAIHDYFTKG